MKAPLTQEQIDARRKEAWEKKKTAIAGARTVKIVSIDIPFLDLVWLLAKIGLAAIPAAILLAIALMTIRVFLFGL